MNDLDLTDREIEVIRHSLGLNRDRFSYRNYFAADRDSEDDAIWLGLVKRRLAIGRETSVTPDRTYSVGLRAANAVRRKGEHLSPEVARRLRQIDENLQKLAELEASDAVDIDVPSRDRDRGGDNAPADLDAVLKEGPNDQR